MNEMPPTDNWIIRRQPLDHSVGIRLFCFHHAGGSAASFRTWPSPLGNRIEVCAVQTPGRENLFVVARHRRIETLLQDLMPRLRPWLDRPFAFFGHSLGGLVAFAAASNLDRVGGPLPRLLQVSGCRPPHLPPIRPDLSEAPEEELISALRDLGSNSFAALENLELRNLMMPVLRDDLAIAESCRHSQPDRLLPCPISVFAGAEDVSAEPNALHEWEKYTRDQFRLRIMPGGHFFIEQSRDAVLEAIRNDLQEFAAHDGKQA